MSPVSNPVDKAGTLCGYMAFPVFVGKLSEFHPQAIPRLSKIGFIVSTCCK
jgi:hypothetical protein